MKRRELVFNDGGRDSEHRRKHVVLGDDGSLLIFYMYQCHDWPDGSDEPVYTDEWANDQESGARLTAVEFRDVVAALFVELFAVPPADDAADKETK